MTEHVCAACGSWQRCNQPAGTEDVADGPPPPRRAGDDEQQRPVRRQAARHQAADRAQSGANHVEPKQPTPHRAAWGDANALGLTVSEYPPRGRAGGELRQVARWLAETLAQPDMLKGAAAHAS